MTIGEIKLNDPLTNPNYCGYCKSEPCQCDGHGNYADDEQVKTSGDEVEGVEEQGDEEFEEEEIEEECESPRAPRKLREPMPEHNPRPQRPSYMR